MAEPQTIAALLALIGVGKRIAAFTGAGISTDSGIPDYRGPGGVWEQQRPPTIGDFYDNAEARRAYWQRRRVDYPVLAARQPNDGHRALATLERLGVLQAVITQNIDGLHQKAGSSEERVIELHGSAHRIRCRSCGTNWPAADIQARLDRGDMEPACPKCGGMLRSGTILFGEALPPVTLSRAVDVASTCEVMLVVGSSLVVQPASQLPLLAKRNGASIVIINRTPTPLDPVADVHLLGEATATLRDLVEALSGPT
jgi:NAD-dependent deacetylase